MALSLSSLQLALQPLFLYLRAVNNYSEWFVVQHSQNRVDVTANYMYFIYCISRKRREKQLWRENQAGKYSKTEEIGNTFDSCLPNKCTPIMH